MFFRRFFRPKVNPQQFLQEVSKRLGKPVNMKTLVAMGEDFEQKEVAEESFLDYCESQAAIQSIMDEFQISRQDLQELYHWLISEGAGQWKSRHWVPASTLAHAETLRYVLSRKELEPLHTVVKLLDYFEYGAALEG